MSAVRETVLQILDQLGDDATLEDVQYHLYVRQKIERGLKDVEEGRVIEDEEMERIIQSWQDDSDGPKPPPTT